MIPWSIWNIPIWIFQRYFGYDIANSSFSLLWSKLFLVLALIITLIYTYKIVIYITKDRNKAKWSVYLSFSYLYTYIGLFYAGQNDILICMLGTIAIYHLIKSDNNNNPLFYLFASLAISVKYFFFIPYTILILLTEKKLFKIFYKLFIGIIPILLFKLICYKMPMYLESSTKNASNTIFQNIISHSFSIIDGYSLSLFIFALVILAFIAYIKRFEDKQDRAKIIIYFTTASYILLFMFSSHEFYRMILLMPYIFILFSLNKNIFRLNIILETLLSLFHFIALLAASNYYILSAPMSMYGNIINTVFNTQLKSKYILGHIIYHFLSQESGLMIGQISATISFACLVLILIINYPNNKFKFPKEESKCERYIIICRGLIILPALLVLLVGYFK